MVDAIAWLLSLQQRATGQNTRINRLKHSARVQYPDSTFGRAMRKRGADKGEKKRDIPQARLDELIEQAIVDCYNESEQVSGFFCMMEDRLEVPFTTKLLGQEVSVEKIDLTEENEIVAICRQGLHRQRVGILDLPLPNPRPDGSEWIEAYRYWARWR
jgi:hypothetical protein